MKWYEHPLRIAALQCESEGDSKQVLEVWDGWGFNTEQLLHLSAEAYAGYFRPDRADALREYLALAKEKGIHIIFYIAPGAGSADFIKSHPDCVQTGTDGQPVGGPCMNSPYREQLFRMIRDVAQFEVDGIFLDGPVVRQGACYCPYCRAQFQQAYGEALPTKEDVHDPLWHRFMDFRYDTIANCLRDARAALKEVRPEALLYMNSQSFASGLASARDNRRLVPHQEILGAEGGFIFYVRPDEVPFWKPGATAKLIETQAGGKPTVVFVAGDQKPWNRHLHTDAETRLLYADTVANGASVWYGLHSPIEDIYAPGGQAAKEMNAFLHKYEHYYERTRSVASVALMRSAATLDYYQRETEQSDFTTTEHATSEGVLGNAAKSFNGFYEMLLRAHILFDVIDEEGLFEQRMVRYDTLVLPNCACLSEESIKAITDFVAAGGRVLASFDTSLYDALVHRKSDFGLRQVFGVRFEGDAYDFGNASYVSVKERHPITEGLSQPLIPAPSYGLKVGTTTGRALAVFRAPMQRQYVPLAEETTPAVVVNTFGQGHSVYLAGNVGEHYEDYGLPTHLRLVADAARWLSPPILEVADAPQTLEVVLREQEDEGRYILHLVNFTGEMRRPFQRIVPCRDVQVALRTDRKISTVRALAAEQELPFQRKEEAVDFVVPCVETYEVVVVA